MHGWERVSEIRVLGGTTAIVQYVQCTHCPQAFLYLDSSCRDDVSELKQAFLYPEELQ